jgi:hypothetical protein
MTYAEYEASQVMTYVMTYERASQVMTHDDVCGVRGESGDDVCDDV